MSYQEKRSIANIISTVLLTGFYALYMWQNYFANDPGLLNDFSFWGKTFLILIPVTIVAKIVQEILLAIINAIITQKEEDPSFTDERDKLIELKSIRISHWTFALGFIVAMAALAMGMQPYVMFIILFCAGLVSELSESIAQLIYYYRGV